MSQPEVTVITVSYNAGRYLPACVESVRAQRGVNWEHLLIDNGSTDGTTEYLRIARAEDARLRVIRLPENHGGGKGMFVAGPEASGRYVAFIDGDDLMEPDRLARQVQWMGAHPNFLGVYADARAIDEDGRILAERVFAARSEAALRRFAEFSMPGCHSTGLMKTEAFQAAACHGTFRRASDLDLLGRVLERGRVGFLPATVGSYRRHPAQITVTGRIPQACDGAAIGLLAARRRAGVPEDFAGLKPWLDGLTERAASVGEVHAAFAKRAAREGFARLELYHARRAVRRGWLGSLPRMLTSLLARRAYAGSLGERWTLAWAGPLRLSGIKDSPARSRSATRR